MFEFIVQAAWGIQNEADHIVKQLRFLLVVANTGAIAVLLAIPIGKLAGMVEHEVDAAIMFGWLIFFVPLLVSAFTLFGILFSRPALVRLFVVIAITGSFLAALLSLYTYWKGPPDFALIGIGATILLGLNVLALWRPFIVHLESPTNEAAHADESDV